MVEIKEFTGEKMQGALFHESITDALREVVSVAGGAKKIGSLLWPELPIDQAAGKVRDCLNSDRRERFNPEQVLLLARIGREAGCHAVMIYMSRECGYAEPSPVEPEDEKARLQREYIEATKAIVAIGNRIAEMETKSSVMRVA